MEYKTKFENRYHGGRPKIDFRTASKENYNRFILENPSITISFKQFEECIRGLNSEYGSYILETGNIVKLSFGLGGLSINKKRGRKLFKDENGTHITLPINWDATNKAGKVIYHFNEHTDGFHCKWYWFKHMALIRLKEIWCFRPCKTLSKLLTQYCFDTVNKPFTKYHEYNLKKVKQYGI